MEIRKANINDIDRLMDIFERARILMRESGNSSQWVDGYPQRKLVEEDIRKGVCYVSEENNRITGTFAFIQGDDPTYNEIEGGQWLNNKPYGTIHRAGSSGEVKGLFREYVRWCLGQCGNLRADTHEDNKIMQHLLEKNGFKYCGIITVGDGTPRKAYQRTE